MTIVRVCGASFACAGEEIVQPFDLTVAAGGVASLAQPTSRAASIAARLCAGIVKPTTGSVFVGDYETRLQPPQAKRLVGFVDVRGFNGDEHAFRCEIAFRAAVWGVDARAARVRADGVVAALGAGEDPYSRAVALALVPNVAALVLDQPSRRMYDRVRHIVPVAAIVRTRVGAVASPDRVAELAPAAI